MLTLTSDAAQVVSTIKEQQGVPDGFGLRVFPEPSSDGVGVQLAFSQEPAVGDEVAESEGVRLFVDSALTEPLAASVIDTQDTPEGTKLVLRETEQI